MFKSPIYKSDVCSIITNLETKNVSSLLYQMFISNSFNWAPESKNAFASKTESNAKASNDTSYEII